MTRDFRRRRIARRVDDLERTNNHDVPNSVFQLGATSSTAPSAALPAKSKSKNALDPAAQALLLRQIEEEEAKRKRSKGKRTEAVKSLLIYRKTLGEYLQEADDPQLPYLRAAAGPSAYPPRKICSSCGYFGSYSCPRCGEWSCSRRCLEVHEKDGGCGLGG